MSYGGVGAATPGTGKTRLRESLERAQQSGKPSVGQWMEFPGYSLARTVASMGADVNKPSPPAPVYNSRRKKWRRSVSLLKDSYSCKILGENSK